MAQIVQELLQTSMEVPTESDVQDADQTEESCSRFHGVSGQTCPSRRSVKCQVSPKSSCKGEKISIVSTQAIVFMEVSSVTSLFRYRCAS